MVLGTGRAVTSHGVEIVAGTVDRQLRKVCAQAVALGVLVCKSADLEDYMLLLGSAHAVGWECEASVRTWVGAESPAGHDVGRTEGSLLNLAKVVVDILVEDDSAKGPVGEVLRGQCLGGVENIDGVPLRHFWADDLAVDVPGREVARLDVLKERTGHMVRVSTSTLASFRRGEILVALVRLDVELDIVETPVLRDTK